MYSKLCTLFAFTAIAAAQTIWPRDPFMIVSRTIINQALGVMGSSVEPDANIVVLSADSPDRESLTWTYDRANAVIVNQNSGLVISVETSDQVAPGAGLTQNPVNAPGFAQHWNYFGGSGQIHPTDANDLCITGTTVGTVATVNACNGIPQQSWTIATI